MNEVPVWLWVLAGVSLLVWVGLRRARTISRTDWGIGWLNSLDGLMRLLCRHYHRMEADPVDLPAEGGAVVVSNHVSGLDPLVMMSATERPLRFIIATEQYDRPSLHWLFKAGGCIPVDRTGRPERALRHAVEQVRAGEVVALFPHGKIHLDTDPPRKLKRGAVRLAQITNVKIYPMHISGVRGVRKIVAAVLLRSRVRVRTFPPIDPAGRDEREVSAELQEILDGKLD